MMYSLKRFNLQVYYNFQFGKHLGKHVFDWNVGKGEKRKRVGRS